MNRPLRIALTKGRLEKDTVGLLEKIGYDCTAIREKGRKLILPVPDGNLEVVLAKAISTRDYLPKTLMRRNPVLVSILLPVCLLM